MNQNYNSMNQNNMRGGCMRTSMNRQGYGMNRNMTGQRSYDGRNMNPRQHCESNRGMTERRSCDDNREMMERRSCDGNREMMERRPCDNECGMDRARSIEIPTGSRKELFCFINEVSFAAYEALLYLDTHPTDQEAMQFFREHNHLRNRALEEYARLYGPLTISTASEHESSCWEWMTQPWPWEGGDC